MSAPVAVVLIGILLLCIAAAVWVIWQCLEEMRR